MDKERSKTSLEINKPYNENTSSQQNYSFVFGSNPKTNEKPQPRIKALNNTKADDTKTQKQQEIVLKEENPEQEKHQNVSDLTPIKYDEPSDEPQKVNLLSKEAMYQQEQINFEQFFSRKNKYSNLTQINNSFLSVIETGKITISPQKQSVGYKKNKLVTQSNLEQILTQKQEKIKLIALRKHQMLQQLNKLYAEEREVRSKRKALILSSKVNHQSTKLLRSSVNIPQSPIKRLKSPSKVQILPQKQTIYHIAQAAKEQNQEKTHQSCEKFLFLQQQKKSIARILKERSQKQLQFEQRQKELIEKTQKQKQDALQQQKLKIEAERQRRRSKAMERLQKSKNQRESYLRIHSRSDTAFKTEPAQGLRQNQFFTEIGFSSQKKDSSLPKSLSKKYIYKQFEKESVEKERQRKKYEESVLKSRSEETKIDFGEIRIHLQKYKQIKAKHMELERQKIEKLRNQQKQRIRQIRQKYGFLTKIKQNMLQEERNSIEMMESQLSTKANYQKKMREYCASVKQKTQSNSRRLNVSNRVRTSMYFENEETNDKRTFQASKNSTIFKQSRLEKSQIKNQTHFLSGKKKNSFESISRSDQPIQNKVHKYRNYLSDMKKNSNKTFQSKQKAMMNILKNEQASIEQIQKAFGIFKDLNKSFWQSPSGKQGRIIQKEGSLFSSQKK